LHDDAGATPSSVKSVGAARNREVFPKFGKCATIPLVGRDEADEVPRGNFFERFAEIGPIGHGSEKKAM
jgi:hypothetical protein